MIIAEISIIYVAVMLFGQATALWRRQRTPAEAVYIGRQQVLGLIARTPTTHPRYVISDRKLLTQSSAPG